MNFGEKFIERSAAELTREYSKIFGANVNIARMAPDELDGCKPVARRLLYTMFKFNSSNEFTKVAEITGMTAAKLHHHGPSSIESCLVGLAQWWNNNIPLITPHGNFGSVAGDPAGADRYIKAKLSDYAIDCFFADWKESVVDMKMGANNKTLEPEYLPSKYPNVLINGATGIGHGQASNIPPFNFKEVVEATMILMKDPEADIMLIPDSPTGADIVAGNFQKIVDSGNGKYVMRCKYEVKSEENLIRITALPYQVTVSNGENGVRDKIADIKVAGGLPELIKMEDLSGKVVDLQLTIRDDINPYKFMKKLISEIAGLEKSYPVNIVVTQEYESFDASIKGVLLEWIRYRREQKRIVVNHKRTTLFSEQRTNDVKIFLMSSNNLRRTIDLFTGSRNRAEIEKRLIEEYKNTSIKMDSLQAKTLSEMKFYELTKDHYDKCLERRDEILEELKEIEAILKSKDGVDRLIIGELTNGVKRFGSSRRSNVVPDDISIDVEIEGYCILQLSSDGMIIRRTATNVDEEPVPADNNGFAVRVGNDCSFIAVDENGHFSFIKIRELPVDKEVPLNRYIKGALGNIVALLPYDISSRKCATLISRKGMLKKIIIADMRPSKKACIEIGKNDKVVAGIVTGERSSKDILVYTREGLGQRLDPNNIRITSFTARGGEGFKLLGEDEIAGAFSINPENTHLLYVTTKGKMRLNLTEYLPQRNSKHDTMVRLISLGSRDHLFGVIGCNKLDKIQVWFDDQDSEVVDISKMSEGTMSSEPRKVTKKNAVSSNIVKVKLI